MVVRPHQFGFGALSLRAFFSAPSHQFGFPSPFFPSLLSLSGRKPTKKNTTAMNINIVNLEPTEWDKQTWRDAYAGYCERKPYGAMTKREYYDWVLERHKKMTPEPLSDELRRKWATGNRNARLWAKKRGCDMNGRLLTDIAREQRDKDALETALRAEEIAIDALQCAKERERRE